MVGLFAYLLFWEWSQESAAKAELVATTRVDQISSGADTVDSSNTSKISNSSMTLVVNSSSGSIIGVELSEYPVLQKAGSPNVRLLGSEGAFKFYVKSGFGVESPVFSLKNNDGSSITLVSDDGLYRKVISIKEGYLVDTGYSLSSTPIIEPLELLTTRVIELLLIFEVFELSMVSAPEETWSTLVVATSSAFAADSCDHSQKRRYANNPTIRIHNNLKFII